MNVYIKNIEEHKDINFVLSFWHDENYLILYILVTIYLYEELLKHGLNWRVIDSLHDDKCTNLTIKTLKACLSIVLKFRIFG